VFTQLAGVMGVSALIMALVRAPRAGRRATE
jgi:hypothetical protein